MRELATDGMVSEHTRVVRGDERRQKTWQLTDEGREQIQHRLPELRTTNVLLRERNGNLLEVRADEAGSRLETGLTLLQVLMHAQDEALLNFAYIRYAAIVRTDP